MRPAKETPPLSNAKVGRPAALLATGSRMLASSTSYGSASCRVLGVFRLA